MEGQELICERTPCDWTPPAYEDYRVFVELEGYRPFTLTIPGRSARSTVTVTLQPHELEAPHRAPEPASLAVRVSGPISWADVYMDGEPLQKRAPFKAIPVEPGVHRIRIQNPPAGISHESEIEFHPGEPIVVRFPPKELAFALGRWVTQETLVKGNPVTLLARTEETVIGYWRLDTDLSGRSSSSSRTTARGLQPSRA
jgi:hypothetical protein